MTAITRVIRALRNRTAYCRPRRSARGALAEPGVRLEGQVARGVVTRLLRGATILGNGGGEGVTLGENSLVARWAVIESLGVYVRTGRNSGAGDFCNLYGQGGLTIGDNVLMASGVRSMSEEHNIGVAGIPIRDQGGWTAPTVIEDGAWLGANVVVLAGVTVGAGAVCAAGAVVTRNVAPGALVAGVPARPLTRPAT